MTQYLNPLFNQPTPEPKPRQFDSSPGETPGTFVAHPQFLHDSVLQNTGVSIREISASASESESGEYEIQVAEAQVRAIADIGGHIRGLRNDELSRGGVSEYETAA